MIHYEGIEQEGTGFAIQRQRNDDEDKWYGLSILDMNLDSWKTVADGEKWIEKKFVDQPKKKIIKACKKLGFKGITKDDAKGIKKIFKKAVKLGWFD